MNKFLLFLFIIPSFSYLNNSLDSLKVKLENVMDKRHIYDTNKEKQIKEYKNILKDEELEGNTKYQITKKLILELEYYSFDMALYYTLENIKNAKKLDNINYIVESKILLAKLLVESGRYKESLDVLKELKRIEISEGLLSDYFYSLKEAYSELGFYSSIPENKTKYYSLYESYKDSLITLLPFTSDEVLRLKEKEFRDKRLIDRALGVNSERLLGKKSGSRIYSLITFERSLLYELANNSLMEKEFLIKSAISDIQASVKDNASLSKLARKLYEDKEIIQAHRFINFSLDDAKFFNSKLRFINISNILTVITEAYEKEISIKNKKLTYSFTTSCIVALILFLTLIFIYLQFKKLSSARVQLKSVNSELTKLNNKLNKSNSDLNYLNQELLRSNITKEKNISTYLNLYSDYINKLDRYRKLVKNYVTLNKIDELKKLSKSKEVVDTQMKLFHKNFDQSFLELYPNFITEFNKLLKEDKQISVKQNEVLNTELRIYALIRLGITKSEQIAKILRYSVNTIYNYRVKLKNNAKINREFFEEEVKKLS